MTNHEAIQFLKNMQGEENGRAIGAEGFYAELCGYHVQALGMAIKALEQEPFMNKPCVAHQVCHEDKVKVLDKIRAEIKDSSCGKWYVGRLDGKTDEVLLMDEVMEIIDKYKSKSEGKT